MESSVLQRFVVVLVRPEGPLNVGSVARLCGNFGCDLRLVQPIADRDSSDAMKFAHPQQTFLAQARVFSTVREALTDVSLAIATSSKLIDAVETPVLSVARAKLMLPAPAERVALVFGNERTGLSVDEAEACQRVVRLPTPGSVDSLNLSHAVAVTLTLFSSALEGEFEFRASQTSRSELRALITKQLDARGFFKGGARARDSFRPRLEELTDKMDLSERDVALLTDVLRVLSAQSLFDQSE